MKILILSDIHGNLNALTSVLNDAAVYPIEGLALLGDLIMECILMKSLIL